MKPVEHKIVQSRILTYAETSGWNVVTREKNLAWMSTPGHGSRSRRLITALLRSHWIDVRDFLSTSMATC